MHYRFFRALFVVIIFTLIAGLRAFGQEVSVNLGNTEIALNQYFQITATVQGQGIDTRIDFPEIPGFVKRGISSQSSTNFVNGNLFTSNSIIQNYQPTKEGSFTLKPFKMTINGKEVSVPGATIKVGPPQQRSRRPYNPFDPFGRDPFEEFFGSPNEEKEFVTVKDDAFLALTTNKEEVYVGEGFTVNFSFYVSEDNKAQLEFYDLSNQLDRIKKQITPANSWEENFNIERIIPQVITINNKRYQKYSLMQSTFYPLNQEPIAFPSLSLKFIKYQVAKNPTFRGSNRREDYKTYYTQPRTIEVKSLPSHPLREQVPVGQYQLKENIDRQEMTTGESFNYTFTIAGVGNISSVQGPQPEGKSDFDFYPPQIQQDISRSHATVRGRKQFRFYGVPREPGSYDLGDYFNMVFFDPVREVYDTLSSQITLQVTGESMKNTAISSADSGSFYDRIQAADDSLHAVDPFARFNFFARIIILFMLAVPVIVFAVKKWHG